MASSSDSQGTLLEHFLALRKVVFVSAISVVAAFVIVFYFCSSQLLQLVTLPITRRGIKIIYTAVSEAMMTQLKISFVAGIIVASPVVIWQFWNFIRPALYRNEIRAVRIIFLLSVLLFLCGVAFCYLCIYGLAINFFIVAGVGIAEPMISIDRYLSFLLSFILPFGFSFDLPVVLYVTTRLGLTNPKMLISKFKYVVLIIFTAAAVLTPPDVLSQLMLGFPMLVLYGLGIIVSFTACKKSKSSNEVVANSSHSK
ncbi:MAG: twin-arginine translocase subunit TatC [Treponema sp.]|nr:twin-arginine translocase subunit TatC [Treponema sp.]